MQQSIIEPPLVEPVSLEQAKFHLRYDLDAEDALIRSLITAARSTVEGTTKRGLIRQRHRATFSHFPRVIELPVSPVRKVNSISYVDSAGATQTLASSSYQVDTYTDERAVVMPVYGETWPSTQPQTFNAVTVDYLVGYAVPFSTDYSSDANQLTALAHPFADDEALVLSTTGEQLPDGLDANTLYYVVNATADALELATSSGGSPVTLASDGDGQHLLNDVPEPLRQAMLLMVGHWFRYREVATPGRLSDVPFSVRALMDPYISHRF